METRNPAKIRRLLLEASPDRAESISNATDEQMLKLADFAAAFMKVSETELRSESAEWKFGNNTATIAVHRGDETITIRMKNAGRKWVMYTGL